MHQPIEHAKTAPSGSGYGVYILIWLTLLVFTGLTVAVAGVQLRFLAVVVALGIASVKSALVISYFMHLKYEDAFFKRIVLFIIAVLAVILVLTFSDVLFR